MIYIFLLHLLQDLYLMTTGGQPFLAIVQ